MISNDIANLSDCLSLHVLHDSVPSPEECSRIADALLKLAQAVARMEGLPRAQGELQFVRGSRRSDHHTGQVYDALGEGNAPHTR